MNQAFKMFAGQFTRQKLFSLLTPVLMIFLLTAQSSFAQCVSAAADQITALAGGSVNVGASAPAITVFNSAETGGNSAAIRTTVDGYDDAWRAAVTTTSGGSTSFSVWSDPAAGGDFANPLNNLFVAGSADVDVAATDMAADLTVSHDCDGALITGDVQLSNSATLQGGSPRPASVFNSAAQPRTYGEGIGLNSTRNALTFTFNIPVRAFGAWFGDLETRTDGGGTAAIVRLLDASGNRIGSDVLIEPRSASQTACANTADGCGNGTTRFIGFNEDSLFAPRVKQMVVIVGDEDSGGTGFTEHVGFAAMTLPAVPTAAQVSATGRVLTQKGTPIDKARLQLLNTMTGETRLALSSPNGYFVFHELHIGEFYVISANHKKFTFAQSSQAFQMFENQDNLLFVSEQ